MHWSTVARRQHGVISRRQLLGFGLTDRRVAGLVCSSRLALAVPGVYCVVGAPSTYESGLWIGVLATGGVVGAGAACQQWRVISDPPETITLIVPQARRVVAPPGTRIRRSVIPILVVDRWGLPVTDRATSILDHLAELPEAAASTLFDRALQQNWLTPAAIEGRLARRIPGNGQLRRLTERIGEGAESALERAFHQLLRRSGITGWISNLPLCVGGRLIARIDVAFAERQLAIELDGRAHHSSPEQFQRDRTRQNRLTELGWRVLRFTWADVSYRPDEVVATIRSFLIEP